MDVKGSKALVLGGWGLVGIAVCRELLAEAGETVLSARGGDIFALAGQPTRRQALHAQLKMLTEDDLDGFALFRLLQDVKPDVVIDCVNTATGIAYRNVFKASAEAYRALETGTLSEAAVEQLLETLYVPRLIRHVQVLYEGMMRAGTRAYVKVGTSGTGGMGLNIPYTHSEEKPSRVLLAKSAMAGAVDEATVGGSVGTTKKLYITFKKAGQPVGEGCIEGGSGPMPNPLTGCLQNTFDTAAVNTNFHLSVTASSRAQVSGEATLAAIRAAKTRDTP